jgi:hypothetical protein
VSELERANDWSSAELALADQRLRVDGQPRLAGRTQDVVSVEVLVE